MPIGDKDKLDVALEVVAAMYGQFPKNPGKPPHNLEQMAYESYLKMIISACSIVDKSLAEFERA